MNKNLLRFLPADLLDNYEVHNFRHAAEILATSHPNELGEIIEALRAFSLTTADILKPGGNESDIPKKVSATLRPNGWYETRIHGDLVVTMEVHSGSQNGEAIKTEKIVRENYLDGHKVDYLKGRVAFDLEWNSKDQTFDRDLYAFRAFSECGLIDVAILLTRSADLNEVFADLGVKSKYGASTTWMGKLLYRMNAGRNGGCPVLVFGITQNLVTDWKSHE
jgi:hypothetical protein